MNQQVGAFLGERSFDRLPSRGVGNVDRSVYISLFVGGCHKPDVVGFCVEDNVHCCAPLAHNFVVGLGPNAGARLDAAEEISFGGHQIVLLVWCGCG